MMCAIFMYFFQQMILKAWGVRIFKCPEIEQESVFSWFFLKFFFLLS